MIVRVSKFIVPVARIVAAVFVSGSLAMPAAHAEPLPPEDIRASVRGELPDAVSLFREFLALPNDAHFPDDIDALVAWLESEFAGRGFETARIETGGAPLLLAKRVRDPELTTLLVYLQADGQPVDPAAWAQADPYLAVLKERDENGNWSEIPWERLDHGVDPDWRIFARSAADSKGPMTQFLTAVALLDEAGYSPQYNLEVLVDTEEELGSPHLEEALRANRDRFDADMLLVFDGPPHVSGRPTVVFGARGIATATLTTYGPEVAQHSGHFGNFVPNPAFRLARLLASMKSADGRVTIDGFYDGVDIDEATRETLDRVPDDEPALLDSVGVAEAEAVGDTLQEAIQYPSLNVRGLSSGWVGSAARTIIPPEATAELDVRLVADSDADRLLESVRAHIEAQDYYVIERPPTAAERRTHPRIATFTYDIAYGAFRSDFDAPPGRMARRGMRHLFGEEPILIRSLGGSVPIAPIIDVLDVPAALVPTVNPDNNQHSPNENLRLGDFIDGIAILMSVLSRSPEPAGGSGEAEAARPGGPTKTPIRRWIRHKRTKRPETPDFVVTRFTFSESPRLYTASAGPVANRRQATVQTATKRDAMAYEDNNKDEEMPLSETTVTLRLADIQRRCAAFLDEAESELELSLEEPVEEPDPRDYFERG